METKKEITPLALMAAEKIGAFIEAQIDFLSKQDRKFNETILGGNPTDYDLRQLCTGETAAERTLEKLQEKFSLNVGMTYEEYRKINPKAKEVPATSKDIFMDAMKTVISEFLDKKQPKFQSFPPDLNKEGYVPTGDD